MGSFRAVLLLTVLALCVLIPRLLVDAEKDGEIAPIEGKSEGKVDFTNPVDSPLLRGKGKRNKDRGSKGKLKKEKKRRESPEKIALSRWAESLSERDYNHSEWRRMYHSSSAADFFNAYARKLSKVFKDVNAKLNFAMVGACDGTGDNTIKHLYLPNDHWRGVFVEPMSINVRDLILYLAEKNVAHRSKVIRGAATSHCDNATLFVERPLYEEKNASLPHWLRRQIGSVLPEHRKHARKEWTLEEVRCLTAEDILRDWAANTNNNNNINPLAMKLPFRRPHVLKIDVEGHDYEVLMSFMRHDVSVSLLPLIVSFEAKSIAKKYPLAKQRMELL